MQALLCLEAFGQVVAALLKAAEATRAALLDGAGSSGAAGVDNGAAGSLAQRLGAALQALQDARDVLTQSMRISLPVGGITPSEAVPHWHPLLQPAAALAALMQQGWQQTGQGAAARLELAQAAATRSCAHMACANLAGEGGGQEAGDGGGGKLCGGCRAVRYCGVACSHADWRAGGHRRVCRELAAARAARA